MPDDQYAMRLPMSGVIVFSVAEHCNASCEYCYLRHSNDEPTRKMLSRTDLEIMWGRYVRELRRTGIPGAGIFWHGGDALACDPDWLDMAVSTVNEVFDGCGIEVRHAMQTNLMIYDDKRRDVLRKHFSSGLGSSLDYPNIYRRFGKLHGEEYNRRWIANYKRLIDDGLTVSSIAVANKETLRTPPAIFARYFLKTIGISGIQINFPFGDPFWLDPKELGSWLLELLNIWYDELGFFQVSPFSNLYRRIHWDRGQMFYDGMCVLDADCTRGVIGIGPTGKVSQCDTWRGDTLCDNFGNLLEDTSVEAIMEHPARRAISQRWKALSDCISCEWFKICGGGCARRAIEAYGTLNHKDYYCETYRMLYEAIAARRRSDWDRNANAVFACTSPRSAKERQCSAA